MDPRIPNRVALIRLYRWAKTEDAKRQRGLPSEWDQVEWIGYRLDEDCNHCGTVCCLAGKTVMDAGAAPYGHGQLVTSAMTVFFGAVELEDQTVVEQVPLLAARILGLDPESAEELFFEAHDMAEVRASISAILGGDVEALVDA